MNIFNKEKNRKRYNPSLILVLSFLLIILIGTILLLLPISHKNMTMTFLDALFTATTSTCVTGLMTICAADLSLFGQIVVLVMIQVGGLGLMSFVAVIMMMFGNKLEFSRRDMLKEALNKENFADIGKYIIAIFKYTLTFETAGFLLLLTQLYDGSIYSIFQSLFLSVSAFCNAGIDILGSSSLLNYQSNILINLVIAMLIIFGGLGFAVWFDFYDNLKKKRKLKARYSLFDRLSVNTRIVVLMTTVLIFSGMFLILISEWNGVLKDHTFFDKLLLAFFNSVTLRTAGFSSIDYSALNSASKIIMCIYMLVGASPGGTGGGMKTTTFFVLLLAAYHELRGSTNFHIFNHHVPKRSLSKALTIMLLYIVTIIISMIALVSIEYDIDSLDLLFEVVSALGTVGLSVGITARLSVLSKLIIIIMMFVGRLGPVTIALLLKTNKDDTNEIKYPKTEILLG